MQDHAARGTLCLQFDPVDKTNEESVSSKTVTSTTGNIPAKVCRLDFVQWGLMVQLSFSEKLQHLLWNLFISFVQYVMKCVLKV